MRSKSILDEEFRYLTYQTQSSRIDSVSFAAVEMMSFEIWIHRTKSRKNFFKS